MRRLVLALLVVLIVAVWCGNARYEAENEARKSDIVNMFVYIAKTGKVYHRSDCDYLRDSKLRITLNDALENGYLDCKICRPILGLIE